MLWVARREKEAWLRKEDINEFPCRDLHTIDQLWLVSSEGKFGFSVQKQIWNECGGIIDTESFMKRVKWLGNNGEMTKMCWDSRAVMGHLPNFVSHWFFSIPDDLLRTDKSEIWLHIDLGFWISKEMIKDRLRNKKKIFSEALVPFFSRAVVCKL